MYCLTSFQSRSQPTVQDSASQLSAENDSILRIITVRTYIHHISNLNFRDQEYKIEFWLYLISKNRISDSFKNQVAVKDSKDSDFTFISLYREDSVRMDSLFADTKSTKLIFDSCFRRILKIESTIIQKWKLDSYPFDPQNLDITIYLIRPFKWGLLRPVLKNINYSDFRDKTWEIENGWYSEQNSVSADTVVDIFYNTQKYSALQYHIELKRHNIWGLFFKLTVGMYVAFLVAFISFFIPIHELEPRFGLPVGGLFAAIANKYIIESLLPPSSQFVLIDKLHSTAIISILLIIIYSTVLQSLILKNKNKSSEIISTNTKLKRKSNRLIRSGLSYADVKMKWLNTFIISIFLFIYISVNIFFIK
jgi:hypothetical protein